MSQVGQNPADRLAGVLHVAPGAPLPNSLQSTRQDWAGRLGPGQSVTALPDLMASLFSLCGHSHRLCSQLAIDAAMGGRGRGVQKGVPYRLRVETAQEHIRRLGLDWPRLLGRGPLQDDLTAQATAALRDCPRLVGSMSEPDPWLALRGWLQADVLKMAPKTWLRAWQACGADWLHDWCLRHDSWLSHLVRLGREVDAPRVIDQRLSLPVPVSNDDLSALVDALRGSPDFPLYPTWRGAYAHTGSWTRWNRNDDGIPMTAWALLGSRMAELIRLSLPDESGQSGSGWLTWGSQAVGDGQGLAWVEMARGMLMYLVKIEDGGPNGPARVMACRVVAPTEWNFHPRGEVAERFAEMDPQTPVEDAMRHVRLLMAAFDPCVPFRMGGENPVVAKVTGTEHRYA